MSWVTVVWSMIAAACLTLAASANLLFALTAVATTFFAAGEMWMMHAATPEEFATALRWTHIPMFVLIVTLVGFVRFYLRAGRPWLAWTVCGGRALAARIGPPPCRPRRARRQALSLAHRSF